MKQNDTSESSSTKGQGEDEGGAAQPHDYDGDGHTGLKLNIGRSASTSWSSMKSNQSNNNNNNAHNRNLNPHHHSQILQTVSLSNDSDHPFYHPSHSLLSSSSSSSSSSISHQLNYENKNDATYYHIKNNHNNNNSSSNNVSLTEMESGRKNLFYNDEQRSFSIKNSSSPSFHRRKNSNNSHSYHQSGCCNWSKFLESFKKYLTYCGPGYLIAIGYMDPGNWATDIEAGSRFSYSLLYIILISNFMAMILQYLAVRLGVISGLDLAKACAIMSPDWLRWILYILAEVAMIATDLAEVIGTVIALKLLFGLPLIYGVIITAADVLIILSGLLDPSVEFDRVNSSSSSASTSSTPTPTSNNSNSNINNVNSNNHSHHSSGLFSWPFSKPVTQSSHKRVKSNRRRALRNARIIEFLIIILMSITAICFILEWSYVKPEFIKIIKGYFIPDVVLLWNDKRALFLCLGIIGATVMPHNLYLHSALVQARVWKEEMGRRKRVKERLLLNRMSPANSRSSSELLIPKDASHNSQLLHHHPLDEEVFKENTLKTSIKYATIDSTVALFFALLINSAILITAAAGLHFNGARSVTSIEDAASRLKELVGKAAAIFFGLALLLSGQSSTMTGTLAGQVVFEGFLSLKIRPWLRRLITRSFSILPAIVVIAFFGEEGLSELLLYSQVVLSFQLPFAIIPLIWFNIHPVVMKWRWRKKTDNPLDIIKGRDEEDVGDYMIGMTNVDDVDSCLDDEDESESFYVPYYEIDPLPKYLLYTSVIIALIIIALSIILVISNFRGEG